MHSWLPTFSSEKSAWLAIPSFRRSTFVSRRPFHDAVSQRSFPDVVSRRSFTATPGLGEERLEEGTKRCFGKVRKNFSWMASKFSNLLKSLRAPWYVLGAC